MPNGFHTFPRQFYMARTGDRHEKSSRRQRARVGREMLRRQTDAVRGRNAGERSRRRSAESGRSLPVGFGAKDA